ncbi:MAG: hypothetical protein AVDCRST_MAG50-990, partial [uncultured Acidimicrobiales bacterium]
GLHRRRHRGRRRSGSAHRRQLRAAGHRLVPRRAATGARCRRAGDRRLRERALGVAPGGDVAVVAGGLRTGQPALRRHGPHLPGHRHEPDGHHGQRRDAGSPRRGGGGGRLVSRGGPLPRLRCQAAPGTTGRSADVAGRHPAGAGGPGGPVLRRSGDERGRGLAARQPPPPPRAPRGASARRRHEGL